MIFGIYWRDIAPAICSWGQPLLNMNIERNFEATLWRHRWRHHHKKTFFDIIWDDLFISEVRLKLCLIFQILKMAAILSSRQTFLPKVIAEVEYIRKIAISISQILSFWSPL